jgi:hypothetical protein
MGKSKQRLCQRQRIGEGRIHNACKSPVSEGLLAPKAEVIFIANWLLHNVHRAEEKG